MDSDPPYVMQHQSTAHPKPVIPCAKCDISFEDQSQLEQHWRESDLHPLCLICDIGFEGEMRFNTVRTCCPRYVFKQFIRYQHVKHTHPELWCGACGIGFASPGQLLEHYLATESSIHPSCPICGEGFESQAILDEVSRVIGTCGIRADYHHST